MKGGRGWSGVVRDQELELGWVRRSDDDEAGKKGLLVGFELGDVKYGCDTCSSSNRKRRVCLYRFAS